ncbi:hypothetical protein [Mesorhizobium sp.]|uniref:hypothetical protein n=1 Tax=Mesorhizobium sp. TaxID=1871066 RepID=UPI00121B7723|nr:hypothetical protein [Mesorhizobium sp.]TIS85497.1 MAG: hypothetical protein E5W89_32910 [Mesorhizobium sp.]
MRLETASIHYLDDATMFVEIKDGQLVQFSNLNGKSAAFPKSCRLALVFDPFGEIEAGESIAIDKGNPQ